MLALALVAFGIFLGGVAYGFWAGGALGHGVMSALELLVGKLAYLTPIALVLGGARMLVRDTDLAPAVRPLRTGTICLVLALGAGICRRHARARPGRTADQRFLVRGRC